MSDVSRFTNSLPSRVLHEEERELISSLLSGIFQPQALENVLATARVTDMQDGGMGGIRFVGSEPRSLGKALVEAQYVDGDGVLVSIALNADSKDELFELDFWKVDFSPLRRYLKPSDLFGRVGPR